MPMRKGFLFVFLVIITACFVTLMPDGLDQSVQEKWEKATKENIKNDPEFSQAFENQLEAQIAIGAQLKDPDSYVFFMFKTYINDRGEKPIVCGKIFHDEDITNLAFQFLYYRGDAIIVDRPTFWQRLKWLSMGNGDISEGLFRLYCEDEWEN